MNWYSLHVLRKESGLSFLKTCKYYNKNSDKEATILSSSTDECGNFIQNYDTIFECQQCHIKIMSENNHFYHSWAEKRTIPLTEEEKPKKLKLGWKIEEEIGTCWIDSEAISKINLD